MATNSGFSLLELSIVLVIIGLLTGGVMTGQSLIRAAEMRSAISDYRQYLTAVYTFRDKYAAYPGDMRNATTFWGAAHATPATCRVTSSITAATCDGNGDGKIDTVDAYTTTSEKWHFWKHLANAGLVGGSYTGVAGAYDARIIGTNIPAAKMSQAGFEIANLPVPVTGDPNFFDGSYGFNVMMLIGEGNMPLSGPEAWMIDTKLDDGKPATGFFFVLKKTSPWQNGCSTTDVAATALYTTSDEQRRCYVINAIR